MSIRHFGSTPLGLLLPVKNAERQRTAFYNTLDKIRVKSIRRLLELYYLSYVEPIASHQIRRDSRRRPRVAPGLNAVMRFLGCNKSTAMDYLYALDLIENHILQSRVMYLTRERVEFRRPGDYWSGDLRPR